MIRLLVGLGNPGPEYEATRHNAGFWWVDAAARKLGAVLTPQRSYFGLAARAQAATGTVWLLQTMTYMNLSGKAVAALARFYKIAPQEILVVHDELDLLPGQAKIKLGGGHAGHNGLRDIHAQLGSADYWRLRLGIGHPGVKAEVVDYVLRKPAPEQREAIQACIAKSLEALPLLLDGPMERAVAKIQAKPPRPKVERPEKTAAPQAEAGAAAPPAGPPASAPHPAQAAAAKEVPP